MVWLELCWINQKILGWTDIHFSWTRRTSLFSSNLITRWYIMWWKHSIMKEKLLSEDFRVRTWNSELSGWEASISNRYSKSSTTNGWTNGIVKLWLSLMMNPFLDEPTNSLDIQSLPLVMIDLRIPYHHPTVFWISLYSQPTWTWKIVYVSVISGRIIEHIVVVECKAEEKSIITNLWLISLPM